MSKREDFQKTMEENLALWHARVETIKTRLKTRAPTEKDAEGQKTAALIHSQIYGHKKALQDLATWMKTCAALEPPGGDTTA